MIKRALLVVSLALAGCSGERAPPPQPAPRPVARPTPVPVQPPVPAPAPAPTGFADLPRTPGTWAYSPGPAGSNAAFVDAGQRLFSINCSRVSNRIWLERDGAVQGASAMTVQTSYGSRRLNASGPPVEGTAQALRASHVAAMAADVWPADPLLDQMMFSRGHFAVEVPGLARVVLPSWAEFARVVEDCRK